MINWQVPAPETPHERPRHGRHARTKKSRRTMERIVTRITGRPVGPSSAVLRSPAEGRWLPLRLVPDQVGGRVPTSKLDVRARVVQTPLAP